MSGERREADRQQGRGYKTGVAREEERKNLLQLYKDMTMLRSEVVALEIIALPNDDVQHKSVADVFVSRLSESLSGLEALLRQVEADRDRLDRRLAVYR